MNNTNNKLNFFEALAPIVLIVALLYIPIWYWIDLVSNNKSAIEQKQKEISMVKINVQSISVNTPIIMTINNALNYDILMLDIVCDTYLNHGERIKTETIIFDKINGQSAKEVHVKYLTYRNIPMDNSHIHKLECENVGMSFQ